MPFTCQLKVRFGDVDHAGVAYYPTIIDYFHLAFEEFWEHWMGVPYPTVVDKERLGFPTVHLDVDFVAPLTYGDRLSVQMGVEKVGTSSVTFRYLFVKPSAQQGGAPIPCVRGTLTVVAVDLETFAPKSVPGAYRAKFEACSPPSG